MKPFFTLQQLFLFFFAPEIFLHASTEPQLHSSWHFPPDKCICIRLNTTHFQQQTCILSVLSIQQSVMTPWKGIFAEPPTSQRSTAFQPHLLLNSAPTVSSLFYQITGSPSALRAAVSPTPCLSVWRSVSLRAISPFIILHLQAADVFPSFSLLLTYFICTHDFHERRERARKGGSAAAAARPGESSSLFATLFAPLITCLELVIAH